MSVANEDWVDGFLIDPETVGSVSIVGVGHVTTELEAIAARINEPERAQAMGLEAPRGVLLWGRPGTGKTLSARYLTQLLGKNVRFYEMPAAELTPRKVGWLIPHLSRQDYRSVIYIDEVDTFAIDRDDRAHTPKTKALLMATLAALDGLVPRNGPLVVVASNRNPVTLDPAFVRSGRFDLTIALTLPDTDERCALLEHFANGLSLADDVDWTPIAEETFGATPAQLKGYLQDAAAIAFRKGRSDIDDASLGEAVGRRGRVVPEREPEIMSDADRRRFSIHEAGHAVVAATLFGLDGVRRVSIDVDGGDTQLNSDRSAWLEQQLLDELVVAFGGLEAERAVLGEASTGTTHDMEHALWLLRYRIRAGHAAVALPVDLDEYRQSMPPRILQLWAQEVEKTLEHAHERARLIVEQHLHGIAAFADRVADAEELDGDALRTALAVALAPPDA